MEKNKYNWAFAFIFALVGTLMSITPIVIVFCGMPIARTDIALIIGGLGWLYALAITIKQLGRYL